MPGNVAWKKATTMLRPDISDRPSVRLTELSQGDEELSNLPLLRLLDPNQAKSTNVDDAGEA